MNEIKSNGWFNWKLSYSIYLNVMNVYIKFMKFNVFLIKFMKFNVLLIKFYESISNFINFHEKYIKFYVYVHTNIFFSYKLNLM